MRKIQHYVQGQWTEGTEEGAPIHDAITGDVFSSVAIEGLDIPEILHYGRTKGGEVLRKMTFQERGNMLKSLALYLTKRKDAFYELSYRTGATKVDSWIDIEGGFGNLFANASLRKLFPNQKCNASKYQRMGKRNLHLLIQKQSANALGHDSTL